jgi:hypothetical protein
MATELSQAAPYVFLSYASVDRADDAWLPMALHALAGLGLGNANKVEGDQPRVEESPQQPTVSAPPRPATPHNLPASMTSFVGRERALAEVQRLLQST